MSSPALARRAARRIVPALATALVAACTTVPAAQYAVPSTFKSTTSTTPSRMAPMGEKDAVAASLLMRMTEQQEAAVLTGLAPVVPSLLQRVWGLPPAGEPWRLEVMMAPWRLDDEGHMQYWVDATVASSPRDQARYAFRQQMESALRPPAPSRAWYVGTMRGVSVLHARVEGELLVVQVDVSAGMRCDDGRNVLQSVAYDISFVREAKGQLHLADRPPQYVAMSGRGHENEPAPTCAPKLLVGDLE